MCATNARLDGKVVVVTGSSSGIGLEVAKNLAHRGAKVIIASRNETKLKEARNEIVKETGNSNVVYKTLDLGSLSSVRHFASEINLENKLDVLINNAGAVGLPDTLTADDSNLTMQVNFFGAFLLTYLLLPKLKASAPSRIINGSASSMYIGIIDFDHWNDIGTYSSISTLANSKLAVALFSAELHRRLKGSGVTVNSFDPFVVRDTDILKNVPGLIKNIAKPFINLIGQSKEDVGEQVAYLAAAPEMEAVSGEHFKFCGRFLNHWSANDGVLTGKLWNEAKRLVKITKDEDWEVNES